MVKKRIPLGLIVAVVIVIGILSAGIGIRYIKVSEIEKKTDTNNKLEYSEYTQYIVDVYEKACLRKEPYINSEVRSYVDKRQKVKILSGWGDEFVRVETEDGLTGYMLNTFISPDGEMVSRANQEYIKTDSDTVFYVAAPSSVPIYNGCQGDKVSTFVPIGFVTNSTPLKRVRKISEKVYEVVVLDSGLIGYINTEKISKNKSDADKFRQRIQISNNAGRIESGSIAVVNSLERVPVFKDADKKSRIEMALVPGSWLKVISEKDGFSYVANAFDEMEYLGYVENRYLYVE